MFHRFLLAGERDREALIAEGTIVAISDSGHGEVEISTANGRVYWVRGTVEEVRDMIGTKVINPDSDSCHGRSIFEESENANNH